MRISIYLIGWIIVKVTYTKRLGIILLTDFPTDLSQDICTGRANGLYPDPDNCQGFIDCVREISFKGLCSPGMAFDTARHMCDYIQNVPGCNDASHM